MRCSDCIQQSLRLHTRRMFAGTLLWDSTQKNARRTGSCMQA